jgi:hypothetical protein
MRSRTAVAAAMVTQQIDRFWPNDFVDDRISSSCAARQAREPVDEVVSESPMASVRAILSHNQRADFRATKPPPT